VQLLRLVLAGSSSRIRGRHETVDQVGVEVIRADRVHVDAERLREDGDAGGVVDPGRRLQEQQLVELVTGLLAYLVRDGRPWIFRAFHVTARLHQQPELAVPVHQKVLPPIELAEDQGARGEVVLARPGVEVRHARSLAYRPVSVQNGDMAGIRTERGLDRLVNFSDATVAIAITLLILPLVDDAHTIAHESFGTFFSDNFWQLLAFAISFAVIARFWVVHHRVFEWVSNYNGTLIWLNFVWLATIAFMPFTTNVLSNSNGERPEIYALYIGNLLAISLSMQLIGMVLTRSPDLVREDARAEMDSTRGWSASIIIAVSLVLAVLVPQVGMFWLFLMFLSEPLHRVLARLTRRPSQTVR
jgi:uncharacterized membrane protein